MTLTESQVLAMAQTSLTLVAVPHGLGKFSDDLSTSAADKIEKVGLFR
jgi:hypothetical protein